MYVDDIVLQFMELLCVVDHSETKLRSILLIVFTFLV